MEICHSKDRIPIRLSATKRYTHEQIRDMCNRLTGPFFLKVEGTCIAVWGEECMTLACQVCSAYHDWLAYNVPDDDGFEADMQAREDFIKARWEEPASDGSDDGY
jgi:hypothetical protein